MTAYSFKVPEPNYDILILFKYMLLQALIRHVISASQVKASNRTMSHFGCGFLRAVQNPSTLTVCSSQYSKVARVMGRAWVLCCKVVMPSPVLEYIYTIQAHTLGEVQPILDTNPSQSFTTCRGGKERERATSLL